MYVVLKSTYVDTKKAILPKKKSSRRIEVFHLLLGRIHTLLYSSDRYREGSEHIAARSPAFTRETVDESLRGRSPRTRDATISEGSLTRSPKRLTLPIAPAWARLRIFVGK